MDKQLIFSFCRSYFYSKR